jgi:8-oxo-dGTP pyrophosphatase MutT (NUDIX family)
MEPSPFQLCSSKDVYRNPWIAVREDRVIRPGGGEGIFGVVTMNPGSTILAVTKEQDVFLTREFKYAIQRSTLELVSGALNPGEEPLAAAKRELEEEVGLRAHRWIKAGTIDPFTTVIDSPNHMFIALDLERSQQNLDPGEVLNIETVPLRDAIAMVLNGEITHGASCVLILKASHLLGVTPSRSHLAG